MKTTTQLLMDYIADRSIKIKGIANAAGIPPGALYCSAHGRPLRADEFLRVCKYLEVDPMRFLPENPTP